MQERYIISFNSGFFRRAIVSFGLVLAISACTSEPSEVPGASLVSRGYSVSAVELNMSENAFPKKGMFRQNPELVDRLNTDLKARLNAEAKEVRGGDKPAKVNVTIRNVVVANDTSRTLLGADTYVEGDVAVTEPAGDVLANIQGLRFTDAGVKNGSTINGVPVGFLISAAANAPGASDEQRIARLSAGFTNDVVTWLSR